MGIRSRPHAPERIIVLVLMRAKSDSTISPANNVPLLAQRRKSLDPQHSLRPVPVSPRDDSLVAMPAWQALVEGRSRDGWMLKQNEPHPLVMPRVGSRFEIDGGSTTVTQIPVASSHLSAASFFEPLLRTLVSRASAAQVTLAYSRDPLVVVAVVGGNRNQLPGTAVVFTVDGCSAVVLPFGSSSSGQAGLRALRVLEPTLRECKFRLCSSPTSSTRLRDLLEYEQRVVLPTQHKVGVLYVRRGQVTEVSVAFRSEPVLSHSIETNQEKEIKKKNKIK